MNALKPVLVLGVLAGVAYGAFVLMTGKPMQEEPAEEAPPWPGTSATDVPNVEVAAPPSGQGFTPGGSTARSDAGSGAAYEALDSVGRAALSGQISPVIPDYQQRPPADASRTPTVMTDPVPPPDFGAPPPHPAQNPAESISPPPGGPSDLGLPPPPNGSSVYGPTVTGPLPPADQPSPYGPNVGADPSQRGTLPPAGGDGALASQVQAQFDTVMQLARQRLDAGQLAEAHKALSLAYSDPTLSAEQSRQVTTLLDQLAGTVIYSREHLLEPPYRVRAGETLQDIARQYQVPWELLANINGVSDPDRLRPGQELKVVRGPFSAVVNLDRLELTLMLYDQKSNEHCYAGRFRIGVGGDVENLVGEYRICERVPNPPFHSHTDGTQLGPGDANNPLGRYWLGLGQNVGDRSHIGIHGTNNPANVGRVGSPGTICLGDQDIQDVAGILSLGSSVTIRR